MEALLARALPLLTGSCNLLGEFQETKGGEAWHLLQRQRKGEMTLIAEIRALGIEEV